MSIAIPSSQGEMAGSGLFTSGVGTASLLSITDADCTRDIEERLTGKLGRQTSWQFILRFGKLIV